MQAIRPTTILLILLNGCLGVLTVFVWNEGQVRVHEPEHLIVPPLSLPDLADLNSTAMRDVDVAAIRDQAVFYNQRSFYQPPPPSLEIPPPEYELAGTLSLPGGKRVAFVRKKSDQSSRTLHVGDDLEGWRVQLVEPTRVVIMRDDHTSELLDSKSAAPSGLIRGANTPRFAQTGPRVLGGAGSGVRQAAPSASTEARTYRPPPR